jgi:hypothetical protein
VTAWYIYAQQLPFLEQITVAFHSDAVLGGMLSKPWAVFENRDTKPWLKNGKF